MRILVAGLLGQYAFGGVTWDYLQYVLGFRLLGHDVWYLEDTATWAYDPVKQEPSADCSYNVRYLSRVMEEFDLGDRWIYRNEADGRYHGISDAALAEKTIRQADVLINVSGACWLREVTASIPQRFFLDGDPMFTQIGLATRTNQPYVDRVHDHTKHFSFGLNIGKRGCLVPTSEIHWRPTLQPIALEYWPVDLSNADPHVASGAFTTVMNWASYKPHEFEGRIYGQKDIEFLKFIDLPKRTPQKLVIAMGQGVGRKRPTSELEAKGWKIIEPGEALPDYLSYRNFLGRSRAEWSIAKHGYVASWSGWFSCRSACYLALGKPVLVQDTGWSEHLPHGKGVLKFTTLEEAVSRIDSINADYQTHCRAARSYAERFFDAKKVCSDLLEAS